MDKKDPGRTEMAPDGAIPSFTAEVVAGEQLPEWWIECGLIDSHENPDPPHASPSEGAPALRRHRRVGLALRALHDLALQEVQAAILPAV